MRASWEKASLFGYKLGQVAIKDASVILDSGKAVHPIALKTNDSQDCIDGYVFEITCQELLVTDQYEVEDYIRVLEPLSSNEKAWVYTTKIE